MPSRRAASIHVCHLIKGLGRGGAEGLLPQLVRAGGGEVGYSVGYFLPWKDALAGDVEAAGARVRCFGARSNAALLASVPRVARWLREEGADLVHAHLPLAGVAARLAGRLAGVPVVYTEHNLQERYHPWTRRANRWTWRLQERAVAVSDEVAASIRRHLGTRVPVVVVRNGIEVGRPAPPPERLAELRRRLDLPAGAPVVGTVAVLRLQKRLDLWLEAARRVLAARPETRFLVVGDGPLRGGLEAEAARLGIAPAVRFAGLQEDVPSFLALLDLFLMSSEFEGLPLALLEAMAAGVAVVATAVGGIPEVLGRDGAGVLVPFGDPAALADAVLALLADPPRRERLAAAGRRRVEAGFGIGRMARELGSVYREVVARTAAGRERGER
jgi:glycosyltransferase involved in cell wall biosynthesis